jgi:uncharacterized Tic20 family protein
MLLFEVYLFGILLFAIVLFGVCSFTIKKETPPSEDDEAYLAFFYLAFIRSQYVLLLLVLAVKIFFPLNFRRNAIVYVVNGDFGVMQCSFHITDIQLIGVILAAFKPAQDIIGELLFGECFH